MSQGENNLIKDKKRRVRIKRVRIKRINPLIAGLSLSSSLAMPYFPMGEPQSIIGAE